MKELILNDGVRSRIASGDRIVKFVSDGTYDKAVAEKSVQDFADFLDSSVSYGFVRILAEVLSDKVGIRDYPKYKEIITERDKLREEVRTLKEVYTCFKRNYEASCY